MEALLSHPLGLNRRTRTRTCTVYNVYLQLHNKPNCDSCEWRHRFPIQISKRALVSSVRNTYVSLCKWKMWAQRIADVHVYLCSIYMYTYEDELSLPSQALSSGWREVEVGSWNYSRAFRFSCGPRRCLSGFCHKGNALSTHVGGKFYVVQILQCSCSGWPTGNGKNLSNSQACCLAQLLVSFFPYPVSHPEHEHCSRYHKREILKAICRV